MKLFTNIKKARICVPWRMNIAQLILFFVYPKKSISNSFRAFSHNFSIRLFFLVLQKPQESIAVDWRGAVSSHVTISEKNDPLLEILYLQELYVFMKRGGRQEHAICITHIWNLFFTNDPWSQLNAQIACSLKHKYWLYSGESTSITPMESHQKHVAQLSRSIFFRII